MKIEHPIDNCNPNALIVRARELLGDGDRGALASFALEHWPAFIDTDNPSHHYLEGHMRWKGGVERLFIDAILGRLDVRPRVINGIKGKEANIECDEGGTLNIYASDMGATIHGGSQSGLGFRRFAWSPGRQIVLLAFEPDIALAILHLNKLSMGLLAHDISNPSPDFWKGLQHVGPWQALFGKGVSR